jgi:hypothetical protein
MRMFIVILLALLVSCSWAARDWQIMRNESVVDVDGDGVDDVEFVVTGVSVGFDGPSSWDVSALALNGASVALTADTLPIVEGDSIDDRLAWLPATRIAWTTRDRNGGFLWDGPWAAVTEGSLGIRLPKSSQTRYGWVLIVCDLDDEPMVWKVGSDVGSVAPKARDR